MTGNERYAILMAGQLSEVAGMGAPLMGLGGFRAAAGEFDLLTCGAFTRLVTSARQEELSGRFTAPGAVVLFDMACHRAAAGSWGPPAALAGYSLGFYAAASCAGCFPPSTAIEWLHRVNGEMENRFPPGAFGAAVTIGLARVELEGAFARLGLGQLRVANVNNPKQFVFSGPAGEVQAAVARLEGETLLCKILSLDLPLHTDHMAAVAEAVAPWWMTVEIADPGVCLISPVDGAPLSTSAQVREAVLASLSAPTDWVAAVRGVEREGILWALEVSGDSSLSRMTKWVSRGLQLRGLAELAAVGGGA